MARTAKETAAAAEATAKAAAKILKAAAAVASDKASGGNGVISPDTQIAITRLEGQIAALNVSIEAHNIASVERDTRIEEQTKATNGKVTQHQSNIDVLMTDRTIWNWIVRVCVIGTPIAIVVANYMTAK